MSGYRLSSRALDDLQSILGFLAERNRAAAIRLTTRFMDQWDLLATQPHSGQAADEIAAGLRRLVMGKYLAFYRVSDDTIVIIRVLDGRRDLSAEDFSA